MIRRILSLALASLALPPPRPPAPIVVLGPRGSVLEVLDLPARPPLSLLAPREPMWRVPPAFLTGSGRFNPNAERQRAQRRARKISRHRS